MRQFKHELSRKNLLFLYNIACFGAHGIRLFRPKLPAGLRIASYSIIALFLFPGFILFLISSHYLKEQMVSIIK